jgi:RNA-directed DNA polymerase
MSVKTTKTINGIDYYYTKFFQVKKNGKKREINSPCDALKSKQNHLKTLLGSKIDSALPDYVVGFRKNYNLKRNGDQHLGKKWVINLDVKDFFPSITKQMLEEQLIEYSGLLNEHGYLFNDFIEYVILNRALPQGSPTSPLLSNYIGYKLIDTKVYPYLLDRFGSTIGYTRYADDLTISLNSLGSREAVKELVSAVTSIVESDGLFSINKKKVTIMHNSQKQVVTGVVVNKKTSLGKKEKLKYRAIAHKLKNKQIEMTDVLQGKLAYINSIDPDYYQKLKRSFL